MSTSKEVMSAADMERSLDRLACQILEQIPDHESIALIGIQRRGADLAARLCRLLSSRVKRDTPCGELDINLYRDDWTTSKATPNINATRIDFAVEGKTIILIDDVLFTGRTIRCALEAILDFGRPRCVKLLVLVDRGHRELPIQADFVGKAVATERGQQVNVFLRERDGLDQVVLG
jgi:pyrimidine operon attenuation protein/uracil phosphoribosyltransferase